MYLIIDIGNSRVKYYFQENTYFSLLELEKSLNSLKTKQNLRKESLQCYLFSSKPEQNKHEIIALQELIESSKLEEAQKIIAKQIKIFDPSKQADFAAHIQLTQLYPSIGADRVAKLAGALRLHPGKDVILMDFGTATTLSAANKSFVFQGGYISLGMAGILKSLAENTAELPELSLDWIKEQTLNIELGQDTASAILNSTYLAHLALIDSWLKQAKTTLPKAVTVCSGGLAVLFKDRFDYQHSDHKLLESFVLAE